ncbi:MAG TPA: D-alanyl-D-alanine carboxypeptidase [Solirubrobacteraceae bacterium]|nr:D-alanyl-D-alanine carboxypeptidase [Solirubrobacteraceae bacterium]
MKRAIAAALAVAAGLGAAAPADAAPTEREVRRAVAPLGKQVSVVVADARSGKRLAAIRATRRQSLGSTTKLLTAAAVLARRLPAGRLETQVLGPPPLAGVVTGDLVLRGAGDPQLDESQLAALADQLATVRLVTGSVVGDESRFDTVRTGPSGNGAFDPELSGPLSALAYRRGRATPDGPVQADPARAAAARFDDVLEARGVTISGAPRAGSSPPGAAVLAGAASATFAELVAAMLRPSDDWIAELLTKELAPVPGSTAAGAAVVQQVARSRGARTVSLVDGSGLDPRDKGSAADLVAVLRRMARAAAFRDALARPGRPGTLQDRLTTGRARRACRGKTGTLPSGGVSALAGYCTTRNGRRLAFAVLARGVRVAKAQRAQDRVARAIAG